MRPPLIFLVGLLSIAILVSGCSGARESEELGYVIAIGLDKSSQENMVEVTYEIALPRVEGGKSEGSKGSIVVTNTAVTLAESLNLLGSIIALSPTMSHIKVIVVGEELARQGMTAVLVPFMRYREYRGSMFVLVARGLAQDFLVENKPLFDILPSKYFELILGSGRDTGHYLRTSFHQFYQRIKSHSGQAYATLVGVNPRSGEGQNSSEKVPGGKTGGYKAGDIQRQGGNAPEFAGTAIFCGDKMVGTLSTSETRMLAMLLGEYSRGFLSVEDPLDAKYFVNVNLRLGAKPKVKVSILEDRPVIDVNILLEGEFTNIPSGINYEEESYLKLLEAQVNKVYQQEMANVIRRTQELNSDVVGFGYYFRSEFQSYQAYEDYKWNEKYSQAEVKVDVKTKIRRTGLMLKTVPTE